MQSQCTDATGRQFRAIESGGANGKRSATQRKDAKSFSRVQINFKIYSDN